MFTFFVAISDLYISCRNIPFLSESPASAWSAYEATATSHEAWHNDLPQRRPTTPSVARAAVPRAAREPREPRSSAAFAQQGRHFRVFYLHFRIRGYLDFFCRVLGVYKVEVSEVSSRTFFHKEHPRRSMTCQSFAKVISRKLWNWLACNMCSLSLNSHLGRITYTNRES